MCAATSSRVQSAGILGLLLSPQLLEKWYLTQKDKEVHGAQNKLFGMMGLKFGHVDWDKDVKPQE